MPVTLSFDLEGAPPVQRNRIQSMFERFGWQNIGLILSVSTTRRNAGSGRLVQSRDPCACVIQGLRYRIGNTSNQILS